MCAIAITENAVFANVVKVSTIVPLICLCK